MPGGERAIMSGIHGLKHVQCRRSADLPDNDAIRIHAETGADQICDRDRALPLGIRAARFQPHQIFDLF